MCVITTTKKIHTRTQELWIRPAYNIQASCTQASPAYAAGRGGGMDRRQHSSHLLLHALPVASIVLLWEEVGVQWLWHRHRESGNKDKWHQQPLNGYVREWSPSFVVAIEELDCPWFTSSTHEWFLK